MMPPSALTSKQHCIDEPRVPLAIPLLDALAIGIVGEVVVAVVCKVNPRHQPLVVVLITGGAIYLLLCLFIAEASPARRTRLPTRLCLETSTTRYGIGLDTQTHQIIAPIGSHTSTAFPTITSMKSAVS